MTNWKPNSKAFEATANCGSMIPQAVQLGAYQASRATIANKPAAERGEPREGARTAPRVRAERIQAYERPPARDSGIRLSHPLKGDHR